MPAKILIAIQARSTSTRLPNKAALVLDGCLMIEHVIARCQAAGKRIAMKTGADVTVAMLVPYNDKILSRNLDLPIVEGPEDDVLSRYMLGLEQHPADYVVRITGDCPLIPIWGIERMVSLALSHGYDYVSNVDERFRTAFDGADVEVFTERMLRHTAETATTAYDREHVTPMMRMEPPKWAKLGFVASQVDESDRKLSVDTPEDFERVKRVMESTHSKYLAACSTFGRKSVHRQ